MTIDSTPRASMPRAATPWVYVIGLGALGPLPVVATAQTKASEPASSTTPPDKAEPSTPIEWFIGGVAVGIVLTVAWIKIRGGSDKHAAPA